MTEHGTTTCDIHTLGGLHPAEKGLPLKDTEPYIQRWGNRALSAGILTLIGVFGATLIAALLAEHRAFNSADGRLFATLAAIALTSLGTALILCSGVERLTRQNRALARRAAARIEEAAQLTTQNRQAIDTNNRLVAETVVTLADVVKRLAAIEQAIAHVPDYSEGMAKGARIAASVLGIDRE